MAGGKADQITCDAVSGQYEKPPKRRGPASGGAPFDVQVTFENSWLACCRMRSKRPAPSAVIMVAAPMPAKEGELLFVCQRTLAVSVDSERKLMSDDSGQGKLWLTTPLMSDSDIGFSGRDGIRPSGACSAAGLLVIRSNLSEKLDSFI